MEISNSRRLVIVLTMMASCLSTVPALAQNTMQEHIHNMSHEVMPFDVSKTVHIFKMTEQGGVERIVTREAGDKDQASLIQQHLQHEAMRFQNGDYSDPARLHGMAMPGLADLQKGASRIKVRYAALPNGAEIRFQTTDIHMLTAIHRWFGAQLSEHGADARAE